MSLIYSKAFYLASAVVVASTVALAPALRAAPAVDGQAASTPPMDHSAMSKGDQPMTGNAGAMPGMQHGGQTGMMQHDGKMDMMQHHQQMMANMHPMQGNVPTLPGQDAFGAIGEIVAMLEADPKTDWSKIDLEALRQHLIDMNDVTLHADVVAKPVDGGLEMAVHRRPGERLASSAASPGDGQGRTDTCRGSGPRATRALTGRPPQVSRLRRSHGATAQRRNTSTRGPGRDSACSP